MADTQDMKNLDEQQNYALANNSDPKNVQELTSYVSYSSRMLFCHQKAL